METHCIILRQNYASVSVLVYFFSVASSLVSSTVLFAWVFTVYLRIILYTSRPDLAKTSMSKTVELGEDEEEVYGAVVGGGGDEFSTYYIFFSVYVC